MGLQKWTAIWIMNREQQKRRILYYIAMMNFKKIFCLLMVLVCLAGCASQKEEKPGADKTVVTMLYTDDLPNVEKLVESVYTDIDFQIERNAAGTIDGEIERRLRNGHGSDIIASTLATGDVLNYLADLSADAYISSYQSGIMHGRKRI